jgi:hypothetical protein
MGSVRSMRTGPIRAIDLGTGKEQGAPASGVSMPNVPWPVMGEVLLLGSLYVVYSIGRLYGARNSASAFDNAHRLIGWERDLGLPNEAHLQHAFLQVPHLAQAANTYYACVHFPLTLAVLLWLSYAAPRPTPGCGQR